MKKIISILLGICLCGGVFAQTQLKIISFNIHAGYDAPIADIAAFIKEQDPDIVALQEVEYYTNRTGANTPRPINNNINMLNELAYLTGMHGMFYVTLEKCYGGKFGNAILSKHSFDETRRIMLPCAAGTEQRNAAIADIKLPDGTEFSIVDTHIDMSKLDNGMSQIKEVNRIPQLGKHYIVAGDMNRRVGTAEINELSSVWTLALSREFDHIGYYTANGWVVKETIVFSDNQLSDHYPIMVTLEFVK